MQQPEGHEVVDGRRRPWLAMDVYYYDSNLACGVRERFGVVGVSVFDAFLRACKRNPVEGQVSYANVPDFLMQIGLPGLALVDEGGDTWELDMLWTYLGRMKNVRKTVRGRITNVRSTRWERWQNSRSKPENTDAIPNRKRGDATPYKDKDTDITPPTPPRGNADYEEGKPLVVVEGEQMQRSGSVFANQCRETMQLARRSARTASA